MWWCQTHCEPGIPRGTERAYCYLKDGHAELYHIQFPNRTTGRASTVKHYTSQHDRRCRTHHITLLLHRQRTVHLKNAPELGAAVPKRTTQLPFPCALNILSQRCLFFFTWRCWQHQRTISFNTISLPEIQGQNLKVENGPLRETVCKEREQITLFWMVKRETITEKKNSWALQLHQQGVLYLLLPKWQT